MRCEDARAGLSAVMDGGSSPPGLDAHVATCESCTAHADRLERIRLALRYETVGDVPDVVPRVLASLPSRRRSRLRLLPLAAAFTAGIVAGVSFVGLNFRRPSPVAVAEIPRLILRAQRTVDTLRASVRVVEHGWHASVPERVFTGRLLYGAPETLSLHLRDETRYPSAAWVRGPVDIAVDGIVAWWRGPAGCPREALPTCTPRDPRVQVITEREPFSEAAPAPLDLVVPVRSLGGPSSPERLGHRRIDGRDTFGVAVTVAQADPLLSGLRRAGNWRELGPTERVELWLDEDALIPLEVRVPGRFEMRLSDVVVNGPDPIDLGIAVPPAPVVRSAGFRDTPTGSGETPPGIVATVPPGMRPYRSGTLSGGPAVAFATWTDGRAWLRVRTTREWRGGRLFGDLGEVVRTVSVGTGIGYVSVDGRKVAVHASGFDAVVDGSLETATLIDVAGSLGVQGVAVPADWEEAASTTDVTGLYVAGALLGFDAPAVRRRGATATIVYAGAGERSLVIDQTSGESLVPPLDPNARGVRLRGTVGRYSPLRNELEWVEDGTMITVRGHGLLPRELLSVAGRLLKAL